MKSQIINALRISRQGRLVSDRIHLLLYYFLRIPLTKEITISNNDGTFFCGKSILYVGNAAEGYEPEVTKELSSVEGTILDVGGYLGKHSIVAAKNNKHNNVFCFEPVPTNISFIRDNISINNLQERVFCVPYAVSNTLGIQKLYVTEEYTGGHSLIEKKRHQGRSIEVPTITLDYFCSQYDTGKIGAIKIDVENAEILVLEGSRKIISKYKPKIIFECVGQENYCRIRNFLSYYGYTIRMIDKLNNYVAEYDVGND